MKTDIAVARRPRAFVGVVGPDAEDYLQRMVSNDVAALGPGNSCDALMLTPKARVIAPLRVVRRAKEDFLVLTEPELGETVRSHLLKSRFAAKAEIELEQHDSHLLLGQVGGAENEGLAIANNDYGIPALEVIDGKRPDDVPELNEEELEVFRISAGTPKFGSEIDERVLPAEAGLVERAVSLTKGCYPGQEPIARLHYRGHANRTLRVLEVETAEPGTEIVWNEKVVGRVTSAVPGRALGYVRTEVPDDAVLLIGGAEGRLH